jgi:hypothetical protein
MTPLAEACHDLGPALARAEALIAEPDTDITASRTKPGSRPPWNAQAANALLDALELIARLEQDWHAAAAGRPVPRRPMSRTGATITSIIRLSYAIPDDTRRHAASLLTRAITVIGQLPAVDTSERITRLAAPCPYCGYLSLRAFMPSGRLACIRYGACVDSDGETPRAQMMVSGLTAQPAVAWADGLVT